MRASFVFFVGSAISLREPSNLPDVAKTREETIRALCEEYFNEYLEMLKEKTRLIRHEEFLELIYKTVSDVVIEILDCLKDGEPNPNHFFLAQRLGNYFDIILTTNQDLLRVL